MSELRRRQRRAIERGERPDLLIVYFRTWQGEIMQELRRTILAEATAQAGKPVTAPEGCSLADLLAHVAHELEADVMVLLGGVSIFGGSGTMLGVVLAIFTVLNIRNGLGLANVDGIIQTGVIGALLIASVLVPNLAQRLALRSSRTRAPAEASP
jgi:hypothetical protein